MAVKGKEYLFLYFAAAAVSLVCALFQAEPSSRGPASFRRRLERRAARLRNNTAGNRESLQCLTFVTLIRGTRALSRCTKPRAFARRCTES